MKTITKKLALAAILLFSIVANQQIKAQGNVISVTPDSSQTGNTVMLSISGHNTLFSQATTSLHNNTSGLTLYASTFNVNNDSLMTATYTIPNNPIYGGVYDVHAANAAPLSGGFLVTIAPSVVIQGSIFKDDDGNCIFDPTEQGYYSNFLSITVQPGNIIVPVSSNGFYAVTLPGGTYTATVTLNASLYWTNNIGSVLCSTSINVPINTALSQFVTHQDFGVVTGQHVISGTIYVDANSNCIMDVAEQRVGGGCVTFSYGSHTVSVQSNGNYSFHIPVGIYSGTLHFIPLGNNSWDSVICPSTNSIAVNFASASPDTVTNQNFGLTVGTCPKLVTTISTGNMRPCFYHHSSIVIHNITSIAASNVVATVVLDPAEIPMALYSTPWTSIAGNTITYNVGTIAPYAFYYITVWDSTRCNVLVGDTLYISAFADYQPSACVDSNYSYIRIGHVTTVSSDPNSKETTFPFGENITANDQLNYTINFQNTGNDTAFNIVVLDTLPPELDPLTLIPAGGSAPYTFQMMGNNIAKFIFHDIQLPDSTINSIGSHGYINFSINQMAGHMPGTTIQNHAAIYFDFNLPVITNSTYNIIPMQTVGLTENSVTKDGISIYPNPFTNATKFVFKNKTQNSKYSIQLFDVTGKKVKEVQNITDSFYDLNRGDLKAQLYFYKVYDNESQVGVGKLIIME